ANRKLLDGVTFDSNFRGLLKYFYGKYADSAKGIKMGDFERLLKDLRLDAYDAQGIYRQVDVNNDGAIDVEEFVECFKVLAALPPMEGKKWKGYSVPVTPHAGKSVSLEEEDEEVEVEEVEEVPEDLKDLSVEDQRRQILARACQQMGIGTLLVLIFSDPMVDVLGEIGKQTGIPAFYISFILAPLASNASELVAAYNYAQKKTSKTITISLNTLEGAACMNNTFCLGIFLALVYFQGLAWKFTAETISILVVQFVMAIVVLMESTQRVWHACFIVMLFPGALALVYFLENVVGLD
ncbi:unnamed protein product, partial [Polarella glacialis]